MDVAIERAIDDALRAGDDDAAIGLIAPALSRPKELAERLLAFELGS